MKTVVMNAATTAEKRLPVFARSGSRFLPIALLAALAANVHSQELKDAVTRPLKAGDKITFQWPGTQRQSCGVIGSLDVGVDGLPWVWVRPDDLPSAVVHLSVDGTRRECKEASAARAPMQSELRAAAPGR